MGYAAKKSCVCPSIPSGEDLGKDARTSTLMHARCSRLCNASRVCEKDGGAALLLLLQQKQTGTGTCTRSHSAAARRAWRAKRQQSLRKSHRWYSVEALPYRTTTPHALPTNHRYPLRVASGTSYQRAFHTPPSHGSGLVVVEGQVAEEGVAVAAASLMLCLSRDAAGMLQTRA